MAHLSQIDLKAWIAAVAGADVIGAALLSLAIFGGYAEPLSYERTQLWAGLAGFGLTWGLASHSQQLYRRSIVFGGRRRQFGRAFATCLLSFGLILALAFAAKVISDVSRLWLIAWAASATVWVLFTRVVFSVLLARAIERGFCVDRAVILCGSLHPGAHFAQMVEQESRGQIRIAGMGLLPGLPGARPCHWLEHAIRTGLVNWVFIADYDGSLAEANALLSRLTHFSVDVTLLPNLQGLRTPLLRAGNIGLLPTLDVATRPLTSMQAGLKRAEDLVLAVAGLILLLPVLVLVAIAIKIDSRGPVCYRQARAGFHDHAFRVLKFRTMRNAAEPSGPLVQTRRNDPRVTRVGRFLRRTSLDELPQLFNVLCGEMSIVGPRPHALTMTTAGLPLRRVVESYESRHRIKPGITGWAQINGSRGQVETEEALRQRVALDCHYIEHWSLALDAWIIMRTLAMFATDSGAY